MTQTDDIKMVVTHDRQGTPAYNMIGLAIWRLKCFYETFVQGSTAVILLSFCTKNPFLSDKFNSGYGLTIFKYRQIALP
ncbi:MAG: hypothetical protein JSS78_06520 [Bacteroidetes bacterium]|nr:hypothetical protein [Bacteroidota bacterium]